MAAVAAGDVAGVCITGGLHQLGRDATALQRVVSLQQPVGRLWHGEPSGAVQTLEPYEVQVQQTAAPRHRS